MEMDDNKLKRILQEAMEYEADCIMEEVDSDPNVRELIAPEEIHEKLFQQIREQQEALAKEKEAELAEEQELIRLGKIYKKKRSRRKYYILIAAVVCALAVGTVSFGDGKKVFTEIKRIFGDSGQTVVNTDNGDGTVVDEISSEEEVYKEIEEKFGFGAVRMLYMPEDMDYVESSIDENLMSARIFYADKNDKSISYYVVTKLRRGSTNTDVEDALIREYENKIGEVLVNIQEYLIEESGTKRTRILFVYNDAQYIITMTGIDEEESNKIIKNLYFS